MPAIKKKVVHPETGKRITRIYVTGKGWFRWNSTYGLYNSQRNYSQLQEEDRKNIDFSKVSGEKS